MHFEALSVQYWIWSGRPGISFFSFLSVPGSPILEDNVCTTTKALLLYCVIDEFGLLVAYHFLCTMLLDLDFCNGREAAKSYAGNDGEVMAVLRRDECN